MKDGCAPFHAIPKMKECHIQVLLWALLSTVCSATCICGVCMHERALPYYFGCNKKESGVLDGHASRTMDAFEKRSSLHLHHHFEDQQHQISCITATKKTDGSGS